MAQHHHVETPVASEVKGGWRWYIGPLDWVQWLMLNAMLWGGIGFWLFLTVLIMATASGFIHVRFEITAAHP